MKLQHRALAVAFVGVASLAIAGCGSNQSNQVAAGCKPLHDFSTINKGALTVAAFGNPPFAAIEGSSATGVDPDILTQVAKEECLTVQYHSMDSAAVIPAVQTGRADIAIGNWYRTTARAEVVDMTDPTYLDQMALIGKSAISDIEALKGQTVGTVDGYLWVDDLKKILGDGLKVYPSPVNMYQDLRAGRIDVAVDGYGSAVHGATGLVTSVAKADPQVAASQVAAQSTFPVTKGNSGLLAALNADIAALKSSGALADILTKNGLDATAADTGKPRLL